MTGRAVAIGLRKAGVSALAIVLLCAVPVFAEPATSTVSPVPQPAPEVPDPEVPAPDTATVPDTNVTPDASTDPETNVTPDATPSEETSSAIDVPVDDKTKAFRTELARRQAALDELRAKLDELDRELALASEAYNAAVDRLNSTRREVDDTEVDLENATQAYDFQMELLSNRANSIYRSGTFAAIEVLLDSKSLTDFVARVQYLNTIGLADAEVAKALKGQKDLVEQTAADLENAAQQAQALEFELKARQIEVMLRIQERQDMLASAQSDLLELLDQEASRRQTQEADLLRQILSGASNVGAVVSPGSPVETALAYHGIPYLWGGQSPSGFDCSGLVMYVYRQHGVELPHYSGSQFLLGEKIAPAELAPGDVVFFGSPIHHVGIYIGGDYFIHAPRTGDFVKISQLSARSDYAGARRYNWVPRTLPATGVGATSYAPLTSLGL